MIKSGDLQHPVIVWDLPNIQICTYIASASYDPVRATTTPRAPD
jgi:hypothetical protein